MCIAAVALAVLAGAAPGSTVLERLEGGRLENLRVRKFLVGHLEPNTNRFIARGGRDEQAVLRDEVLYFEFSGPIDFDTLDSRTVRIGIPTTPGLMIQARGSFYRYVESEFDPVSAAHVPKRRYRNRFLFDPTSRQEATSQQNPYGFEADSPYVVIIPGADSGSLKTLMTPRGNPVRATFRTTFRTTDSQRVDYLQPSVILLEASDAPGIPLDGRTGVDPLADIVAYFDEPMSGPTFDPATTFRLFDLTAGTPIPGRLLPISNSRTVTFRVDPAYGAGPRDVEVTLTTGLTDASGNPLDRTVTARFTTRGGT